MEPFYPYNNSFRQTLAYYFNVNKGEIFWSEKKNSQDKKISKIPLPIS